MNQDRQELVWKCLDNRRGVDRLNVGGVRNRKQPRLSAFQDQFSEQGGMMMQLLPGRRTGLTRFPSQLKHTSRKQGLGSTVVRHTSKTSRQWSINCYRLKVNSPTDETLQYARPGNHIDADLAKSERHGVGSPLQKAQARCFSLTRETDVDAEDCTLIIQVGPSFATSA